MMARLKCLMFSSSRLAVIVVMLLTITRVFITFSLSALSVFSSSTFALSR